MSNTVDLFIYEKGNEAPIYEETYTYYLDAFRFAKDTLNVISINNSHYALIRQLRSDGRYQIDRIGEDKYHSHFNI